ncbi:MAG: membrane protein insertion efficiency factor YidD [Merismopedia sp. SIO2A8]|nr:membrane protein insertion efficiency factor YidD [Symploca sp. SIO2B6]NET48625.1 membrane protein insertion efficiency factor YidD [Merismopedia sp. SIO2A8]
MPLHQQGLISRTLEHLKPILERLENVSLFPFGSNVSKVAIQGIRSYQRYISPHKGFSCAHRRLHGGVSCSDYFHQMIMAHGLTQAIPLFQERLVECKQSYRLLQSRPLALQATSPPEPQFIQTATDDWGEEIPEDGLPNSSQKETDKKKKKPPSSRRSNNSDWCDWYLHDCDNDTCDCDAGGHPHPHNWGPCDRDRDGDCNACEIGTCDMDRCDGGGCDTD